MTEVEHGVRSHVPALGALYPEDHSLSMQCGIYGTAQWRVIMKKQSSSPDVAVTCWDLSSRVEGWAQHSGIPKAGTRAESGAYLCILSDGQGAPWSCRLLDEALGGFAGVPLEVPLEKKDGAKACGVVGRATRYM